MYCAEVKHTQKHHKEWTHISQTASFKRPVVASVNQVAAIMIYFWSLPRVTDPLHSAILGGFWLEGPMTHLQVVTGDQEDASFDALPPGLGPCRVVFGGELPQLEGWGHCFGQTNGRADASTLPLCAVGRCGALNPHVVIDLKGENLMFYSLRIYNNLVRGLQKFIMSRTCLLSLSSSFSRWFRQFS